MANSKDKHLNKILGIIIEYPKIKSIIDEILFKDNQLTRNYSNICFFSKHEEIIYYSTIFHFETYVKSSLKLTQQVYYC